MVRSGWYRDNFRHSLAARGLTRAPLRRFSFDAIEFRPAEDYLTPAPMPSGNLIANWRKGRRPTAYIIDPKTGKRKSLDHIKAAYGIKEPKKDTGYQVKGVAMIGDQLITSAPQMPTNPEYDIESILAQAEMQDNAPGLTVDTMPTVSVPGEQERIARLLEQQAQRVDGGPPMVGSSSLSTLDVQQTVEKPTTQKEKEAGLVEVPLQTVDSFEPLPMDGELH